MDANVNANANVDPEVERLSGTIKRSGFTLVFLNILFATITLSFATTMESGIVLLLALFEIMVHLTFVHSVYRTVDLACHPKVMSWIAAFIIAAYGALYPVYLQSSKQRWVVIIGWVMLGINVLNIALQYSSYILVHKKDFSHKPVEEPFPAATEEKI